jgi:hypothetical protein
MGKVGEGASFTPGTKVVWITIFWSITSIKLIGPWAFHHPLVVHLRPPMQMHLKMNKTPKTFKINSK